MPGETHYFEDVYARRETLGDFWAQQASSILVKKRLLSMYRRYAEFSDQERLEALQAEQGLVDRLIANSCDYCELFRGLMGEQMRSVGKERWGNNVPRDVFCLNDILLCCPDAKFLVCIRDPRDFLLSYKGKWKIAEKDHIARLKSLYHPVVTTLLWLSSMRAIRAAEENIPQDQIMVQRYEELVSDPHAAVKRVCAFLDIEFEAAMLDVSDHNSSEETDATGIFDRSVGRWRSLLAPDEVAVAQLLAGRMMAQFGYGCVQTGASKLRVAAQLLKTPAALYRALEANSGTRGPLPKYLYQRLRFLVSKS